MFVRKPPVTVPDRRIDPPLAHGEHQPGPAGFPPETAPPSGASITPRDWEIPLVFRLTRNGRGFTLVELLAVIALLALAIGAALPDVPGLDAPPEAADVPPVTNVVYYTLEFEQSVDAAEKEAALRAGFASADGKFLELLRPRFRSESDTLCVGLWLPGDADPEMHVEALREVSGAASVAPTPLSLLAAADSDEDEV